ncbi:MAG: chemotaxis protein CheW [Pleurocapsa sp.]
MSNLPQSNCPTPLVARTTVKQFLKFQLHPDTKVMLPLKQITEVLKIQFNQIVPIPQMPAWVMGVYNWRGEILWMLDLGHLMGLDSWDQHRLNRSNHTAIVLSPAGKNQTGADTGIHLGLVVAGAEDLETCDPATIQSALGSKVTARLGNFLQGYWLKPGGEMILVLDAAAIAAAMPNNL